MKNMKRDYKKIVDHNKRSGVARKELPYKDKLDIILGDRPSAEPVEIFQSSLDNEEGELEDASSADNLTSFTDMTTDDDDDDELGESILAEIITTSSCSPPVRPTATCPGLTGGCFFLLIRIFLKIPFPSVLSVKIRLHVWPAHFFTPFSFNRKII